MMSILYIIISLWEYSLIVFNLISNASTSEKNLQIKIFIRLLISVQLQSNFLSLSLICDAKKVSVLAI